MKTLIIVSSILMVLFNGCSLKAIPDIDLINKFKSSELKAKPDETILYVINQTPTVHIVHARFFVGINDKSYLQEQSSYSRFVLKNKINTICLTKPHDSKFIPILARYISSSSSESYYPDFYRTIDNRKGEIIFLSYIHTMNGVTWEEIDKNIGMTLVMQAKKVNDNDQHTAYGHQIALINPYLVNVNLMKNDILKNNLDKDKARIIFYRTENFDSWKTHAVGIWNKDTFIGSIKGEEYLSIDIDPGNHEFVTKFNEWTILDAKVKANKTYYVEVSSKLGLAVIYTKLIAKKSATSTYEIQAQMSNFKQVTLDKSKINENIQLRLDTALPYIRNILKNRKSIYIEYVDRLETIDGR